jgi:hypothetical protein
MGHSLPGVVGWHGAAIARTHRGWPVILPQALGGVGQSLGRSHEVRWGSHQGG